MNKKSSRSPVLIAAGFLLLAAAAVWGIIRLSSGDEAIPAATNEQRIAFIRECGWETELTHCDLTEVRIPVNFDEVYEEYNGLQLMQGFDLRPYRAHSVKKYTYLISNYREEEGGTPLPDIYANLLVEDGVLIGADISSGEAGGLVTVLKHADET